MTISDTIGRREYENATRNCAAGVHRRPGSISPVRRSYATDSFRSAFHACTPRTCVQKEVFGESEPARSQAKDQAFDLGPRFPRHGLIDGCRFSHLAGEFCIGQAFAHDLADANIETLSIGHFPMIEAKRLLVNVAE